MNKQITLSALTDKPTQARTRKKEFLDQMERIIPWSGWIWIIKQYYYICGLDISHDICCWRNWLL